MEDTDTRRGTHGEGHKEGDTSRGTHGVQHIHEVGYTHEVENGIHTKEDTYEHANWKIGYK